MRRTGAVGITCLLAVVWAVVGVSSAGAGPRDDVYERISIPSDGSEDSGADRGMSINGDGTVIAFSSEKSNLVPGDTNDKVDIFVRNRTTATTVRVSVKSDGSQSNASSYEPVISRDGRVVAFRSTATNLVQNDRNGTEDVFVHYLQTGITRRVSVASDGSEGVPNCLFSCSPGPAGIGLSDDGRFVSFATRLLGLAPVPVSDCCGGVYVHDTVEETTTLVSVSSMGVHPDLSALPTVSSFGSTISGDGRYVAFVSHATTLVPNDTNRDPDVFVHDRKTQTTERVSVVSGGAQGDAPNRDDLGGTPAVAKLTSSPVISRDGRFVMFMSQLPLVPAADPETSLYVHDRETKETIRASVDSSGLPLELSYVGAGMSSDGRFVTFGVTGEQLLVGISDPDQRKVFVRDLHTMTTEQVDVDAFGEPLMSDDFPAAISEDGRFAAIMTDWPLDGSDRNGAQDVYLAHMGPTFGVRQVAITPSDEGIAISGSVRFGTEVLISATDPVGDLASQQGGPAADLRGVSLIDRPEADDFLLSIKVAALPVVRQYACSPLRPYSCASGSIEGDGSVMYHVRLASDASAIEVRIARFGISPTRISGRPQTAPSNPLGCDGCTDATITLMSCSSVGGNVCVPGDELPGSFGSTGNEILVSIPRAIFSGANEIRELFVRSEWGVAAATVDSNLVNDSPAGQAGVVLDNAAVVKASSIRQASVGIALGGTGSDPNELVFWPAQLAQGRFSAMLPNSSQSAGNEIWIRTCLGPTCTVESGGTV